MGAMLLASGGGLAVLSLAIALFSGFVAVPDWPQDRDLAAAILLVYAAVRSRLHLFGAGKRSSLAVRCSSGWRSSRPLSLTPQSRLARGNVLVARMAGPHGDPCSWRADGDRLAGIARGTPRGRTLGHLLSELARHRRGHLAGCRHSLHRLGPARSVLGRRRVGPLGGVGLGGACPAVLAVGLLRGASHAGPVPAP